MVHLVSRFQTSDRDLRADPCYVSQLTRRSRSRPSQQRMQSRTAGTSPMRGIEIRSRMLSGKEISSMSDFLSGHTDTRLGEDCLYDVPRVAKMTELE